LRKATSLSTELAHRPLLTIDLDRRPVSVMGSEPVAKGLSSNLSPEYYYTYKIYVANVGNSTALNVEVGFYKKTHINVRSIKFDMLKKDETKMLYDGADAEDVLKDLADINIKYYDITKNPRFTICRREGVRFALKQWG